MRYTYRYRSFFWPAILILAGIIALLVNTGQIAVERIGQLVDLWPLVLIVIGLELIVRRTVHGVTGDVAAALIIVVAIVAAAAYVTVSPNPSATHTYDASGPAASMEQATVEVNVGAATIDLRDNSESTDLYRAHVEYTGQRPRVQFDEASRTLRIDQIDRGFNFFQNRRFVLTLSLSPSVRWSIMENSGAATVTMNLAQLHITSLQMNTGASKEEITLGAPSGTVPVEINGGALTVHVHRPAGLSTSIDVSGGAITLDADGHSYHAVGHASYSSSGSGADGYQIRVNGGACNVSLDTNAPSG